MTLDEETCGEELFCSHGASNGSSCTCNADAHAMGSNLKTSLIDATIEPCGCGDEACACFSLPAEPT